MSWIELYPLFLCRFEKLLFPFPDMIIFEALQKENSLSSKINMKNQNLTFFECQAQAYTGKWKKFPFLNPCCSLKKTLVAWHNGNYLGVAWKMTVWNTSLFQEELEQMLEESGHLRTLAFLCASKGMSSKAVHIWRILARNYSSGLWKDPSLENITQNSGENLISGRAIAAAEASKILEESSDQELILQHLGWVRVFRSLLLMEVECFNFIIWLNDHYSCFESFHFRLQISTKFLQSMF